MCQLGGPTAIAPDTILRPALPLALQFLMHVANWERRVRTQNGTADWLPPVKERERETERERWDDKDRGDRQTGRQTDKQIERDNHCCRVPPWRRYKHIVNCLPSTIKVRSLSLIEMYKNHIAVCHLSKICAKIRRKIGNKAEY